MTAFLLGPVLAYVIAALALAVLLSPAVRDRLLDQPNARSLHAVPVPRSGGIAIMVGIVTAAIAVGAPPLLWGGALALAALSLVDDWRTLPSGWRLIAHLIVAAVFARLCLGRADPVSVIVAAIGIAWMANLYNFMDGADGLASGMTVFGFAFLGFGATSGGDMGLATLCLVIVAAALAFHYHNFPPARIFMGDAGSVPLGFLAGAIGVTGWRDGLWPWWFPWVVFAPFTVDASVTLARRALRRERIWQAHRSHYYQRLILGGWTHRRTALTEYALMLGTGALALACLRQPAPVQGLLLGAGAVVYACLMILVDVRGARDAGPR